jgi:hypothetical protein
MKNFSSFNEELKMAEIDVLSDILDSIELIADESYESNEAALDEVAGLLAQVGLSFNKEEVLSALEAGEEIEIALVDSEDSEETSLEVFVDESLGKKIDGDIVLRVEPGSEAGKIIPSVMIYFDDEGAQELADVEFEPIDDSEEEDDDESLNEDPHKEMPYDFYGWITQNEIVDLTEISGARTHARFPKEIKDKYGIEGNHDRYDFNPISSTSFYKKNYAKGFLRWMIRQGKITFENSLFDDMNKISEKQMELIQNLCKKYDDYLPVGIRLDFQKFNNYDKPFKNFGNFLKEYKKKIKRESTLNEDRHSQMSYEAYGWITRRGPEIVYLDEVDGAVSHTDFPFELEDQFDGLVYAGYDANYRKGNLRWQVWRGYLTIENSMIESKTDIPENQFMLIKELYDKYEDMIPNGIRLDFSRDTYLTGSDLRKYGSFNDLLRAYKHEKDPHRLIYKKTTAEGEVMSNKKFSDLLSETEEDLFKDDPEAEEETPETPEPEEDDDDGNDDKEEEEESKVEKYLKKAVKELGKELDKSDEELSDEMIDSITLNLKMELETLINGEEEETESDEQSETTNEVPEEGTETLEQQDANSDVIIYEAFEAKDLFNVILFKPTSRLTISRIFKAPSTKTLEKMVKDEYPEFLIQHVTPIAEYFPEF